MSDWNTKVLDRLYGNRLMAVDAQLTIGEVAPVELRVIDQTQGASRAGAVNVGTLEPACDVRVSELEANDIEVGDLRGATIEFNGRAWRIESHEPRPLPDAPGELRLFLVRLPA